MFKESLYTYAYNSLPQRELRDAFFNTFANRAGPDQTVRAAWSGSTLFAYGNMIRYDPILVDLGPELQCLLKVEEDLS